MILGMSLATFVARPRHHQPDRQSSPALSSMFGLLGSKPDAGPDRDLPAVHDPDQRHRLSDSAAAVRDVAAVAHDRHSLAGAAGDRLHRALRHEAFRRRGAGSMW